MAMDEEADTREVCISKALTSILRHNAVDLCLHIEPDGYVQAEDVLQCEQVAIHEVLVKGFVVQQLLPFSIFEADGIATAFAALLPRLDLPSHQTVARIVERLDTQHLAKVQEIIAKISDAPTPIAVSEVDCWRAPTAENYVGLLISGLSYSELLGMWPFSPVRIAANLLRASALSGDGSHRLQAKFLGCMRSIGPLLA
jgi:hypothetical protein